MGRASHLHFISSFWIFSSVVGIFWNCHRKGAFVSLLNTTPSPRSPSAADHSGAQIRGTFVRRPRRTYQEDFQIQSFQDAADSVGAAKPKHEQSCLVSPLWRWYKASPSTYPVTRVSCGNLAPVISSTFTGSIRKTNSSVFEHLSIHLILSVSLCAVSTFVYVCLMIAALGFFFKSCSLHTLFLCLNLNTGSFVPAVMFYIPYGPF